MEEQEKLKRELHSCSLGLLRQGFSLQAVIHAMIVESQRLSESANVVEDCVSAAVVDTLGGTGFALLGTALLEEHKRLLAKYKKVVVALDPDAMSKTLVYTRELKAIGIEAVAMNLLDDLKYRVPEDIAQLKNRMRS